jgi:type II secretory pathway pseudopilin PulG
MNRTIALSILSIVFVLGVANAYYSQNGNSQTEDVEKYMTDYEKARYRTQKHNTNVSLVVVAILGTIATVTMFYVHINRNR